MIPFLHCLLHLGWVGPNKQNAFILQLQEKLPLKTGSPTLWSLKFLVKSRWSLVTWQFTVRLLPLKPNLHQIQISWMICIFNVDETVESRPVHFYILINLLAIKNWCLEWGIKKKTRKQVVSHKTYTLKYML